MTRGATEVHTSRMEALTIFPGDISYLTPVGYIHVDRELSPSVVNVIANQLIEQGVKPKSVLSATIRDESGAVEFHTV